MLDTSGAYTKNKVAIHYGCYILAYSRRMYWDLLMFAQGNDARIERPLKDKRPFIAAGETDSAHLFRWAFNNLPKELFEKTIGEWNNVNNVFDFHLKVETFSDGTPCITKRACYVGKKFYMLLNTEAIKNGNTSLNKYASKGFARTEINLDFLNRLFSLYYFNFSRGDITKYDDADEISLSFKTMKRNVPGIKSNLNKDETIVDYLLTRNAKVSMNTMRAHDDYVCDTPLNDNNVIYLLPFDDLHLNRKSKQSLGFKFTYVINDIDEDEEERRAFPVATWQT